LKSLSYETEKGIIRKGNNPLEASPQYDSMLEFNGLECAAKQFEPLPHDRWLQGADVTGGRNSLISPDGPLGNGGADAEKLPTRSPGL